MGGIATLTLSLLALVGGISTPTLSLHALEGGISTPTLSLHALEGGISTPTLSLLALVGGISTPTLSLPALVGGISTLTLPLPALVGGISTPTLSLPALVGGISTRTLLLSSATSLLRHIRVRSFATDSGLSLIPTPRLIRSTGTTTSRYFSSCNEERSHRNRICISAIRNVIVGVGTCVSRRHTCTYMGVGRGNIGMLWPQRALKRMK